MYLFLFLTLYIFREHRAHHQERQIVSIQPLVAVTLCQWLCRVQVESSLVHSVNALTIKINTEKRTVRHVGYLPSIITPYFHFSYSVNHSSVVTLISIFVGGAGDA